MQQLMVQLNAKFGEVDGAKGALTQHARVTFLKVDAALNRIAAHLASHNVSTATATADLWAAVASPAGREAGQVPQATYLGALLRPPPGVSAEASAEPPRKFRVEARNWNCRNPLDLDTKPSSFVAWRDRTLGDQAGDRPDVCRLLL